MRIIYFLIQLDNLIHEYYDRVYSNYITTKNNFLLCTENLILLDLDQMITISY